MLMKCSENRKELVSEIRSLAQSQGLNTVFTTFLEIAANSLAAKTDPENAEKREQRYQEMASTMTPELLSSYARMLALLFLTVRENRDDPCDILGGIYHELNLNNEWNGQYFTPDHICRFMAQITLPSEELSAKDGPITINEPTCGSGTMVNDLCLAITAGSVEQDIDRLAEFDQFKRIRCFPDPPGIRILIQHERRNPAGNEGMRQLPQIAFRRCRYGGRKQRLRFYLVNTIAG